MWFIALQLGSGVKGGCEPSHASQPKVLQKQPNDDVVFHAKVYIVVGWNFLSNTRQYIDTEYDCIIVAVINVVTLYGLAVIVIQC